MSARVWAYSASPEDTRLSLYIYCDTCGTEWGWARDTPEGNEKLEAMAADHDKEEHNEQPRIP